MAGADLRIAMAITMWENCATWRDSECLLWTRQANAVCNSSGYARVQSKPFFQSGVCVSGAVRARTALEGELALEYDRKAVQ